MQRMEGEIMSLYIKIGMMIMVCLMNLSIQAIFSKTLNPKKSLASSCSIGFMALVALSVFQIILPFIFINNIKLPMIISGVVQIVKCFCVFYMPFILTLFSMKKKRILIIVPFYVEFVSIIIAIKAIFESIVLPIYGILIIILSTVYYVIMLVKYNKIMSSWNFDSIEKVRFNDFFKKFMWGVLLGICLSSWVGILDGYHADNQIVFCILMIVGSLSLFAVVVAFYLIPTIIVVKRHHLQKIPIILINILLGWSLIGWVVALVWACMQSKPRVVHINNESTSTDLVGKLQLLEKLRSNGLITDEEYKSKKSELLRNY